jgi:hypothetical protein
MGNPWRLKLAVSREGSAADRIPSWRWNGAGAKSLAAAPASSKQASSSEALHLAPEFPRYMLIDSKGDCHRYHDRFSIWICSRFRQGDYLFGILINESPQLSYTMVRMQCKQLEGATKLV